MSHVFGTAARASCDLGRSPSQLSRSIAGMAVFSAFSSTQASSTNTFTAGTVALTTNGTGSVLFNLPNMQPGDSTSQCVEVTYNGSLSAGVQMYGTVSGALAPYLSTTMTRGTFPGAAPANNGCAGFTRFGWRQPLHRRAQRTAGLLQPDLRPRHLDHRLGARLRDHGGSAHRHPGRCTGTDGIGRLHLAGVKQLAGSGHHHHVRAVTFRPAAPPPPPAGDAAGGWLAGFAALAILLAVPTTGGLVLAGYHPATDRSNSMAPYIHRGDVLFSRPVLAAQVRIGDVITFPDPYFKGILLTHRVRAEQLLDRRTDRVHDSR